MIELTEQEYKDFMLLLSAFGYQITYVKPPDYADMSNSTLRPGLNIIRDIKAIKAGMVIADDIKQKIYQIIKENMGRGNILN